ncbi:MAG TPA: efflux RND transporter periplasmic adaptor subunit [Candidatus Acidoferrum sp.]|nr:efflux RND transporter periplasmic adaptor subunit [Candidatus Acidoferrum sp.]
MTYGRNVSAGGASKDQTGQNSIVRSDHNQGPIQQASYRRALLLGCLTLPALMGGCARSPSSHVLGDAAHPMPVHLYTVAEEKAQRRVQAVGTLFALEESILSSEVEGRVVEVLADVGDTVRQQQPLIVLDPQELQFEVDRQRGQVRQVCAQLGVGPNDPPPSDPKTIASVQRAEADLFDANGKYKRAREMFKDHLISEQQLDEAASRFQSAQASYNVALQEVDRLKALLISTEASEKLAEKKLSDATIRAPFPGSIKTRNVHPGEYLRVQSPVMVLVRTDRLRALLAVPERWAGWVRDGALVDLQVEAFPGETFHGKVSRINPAVSQDSRTFEAEALLVNLDGRLKPGFFVQASIPSEKEEKTIFLPERAVNYRYGVYKVFLVNGNHVSERQIRPAGQTEDTHGRRFEVADGLKPGDRVAVAISGDLHDGATVEEKPDAGIPALK